MGNLDSFSELSQKWFQSSIKERYSYNFNWMGRPIIQYPSDIIAMQEIIWQVKPDLIIETGVAHGGSLVFYASMLSLIGKQNSLVVGIDIDIREHNRQALEQHPLIHKIHLIEGSSTGDAVLEQVRQITKQHKTILAVLDSNHTHDHVLEELRLYSPFVSAGSYLVVFDTCIEDLPENSFPDRPWEVGDNPKTAVDQFLKENDRFQIDSNIESKLKVTVAPSGYLKCIKEL